MLPQEKNPMKAEKTALWDCNATTTQTNLGAKSSVKDRLYEWNILLKCIKLALEFHIDKYLLLIGSNRRVSNKENIFTDRKFTV